MIVTPEEIQTALQVNLEGPQLAMLRLIAPLVEGIFKSWLNTNAEYQLTTEILPVGRQWQREPSLNEAVRTGDVVRFESRFEGLTTLQLKNTPVWEDQIQAWEDLSANAGSAPSAFSASSLLTYGNDYWLDVDEVVTSGRLSRTGLLYRSGYWPQEPRTVKVTYYGGETAIRLKDPNHAAAIKAACLITQLHAFKQIQGLKGGSATGPKTGENLTDYSYSTTESLASVLSSVNFGVPLAAQLAAGKAKNYAVFG